MHLNESPFMFSPACSFALGPKRFLVVTLALGLPETFRHSPYNQVVVFMNAPMDLQQVAFD